VLLEDDDPAAQDSLAAMLARCGANVRATKSTDEAMILMDEFHPQVLLCDFATAQDDRYSFIGRIRTRGPARGGSVPALALSPPAEGDDHLLRALSAGFQMHVAKPVDAVRLTQAVLELAQLTASAVGAARDSVQSGGE
jgi:two-component system CheB/CheR fusion protein